MKQKQTFYIASTIFGAGTVLGFVVGILVK